MELICSLIITVNMISRFNNLFKKNDLDEQRAFQSRVYEFLEKNYPHRKFEKSSDVMVIVCGENQLGLTNLYSKFLLTSQSNYEFNELAKEHFKNVFANQILVVESETFEEIKSRILPQIMPAEYRDQMSLLSDDLGDQAVVGFVIDGETTYQYVNRQTFENWQIEFSEFKKIAVANLAEISNDLQMTFVPMPTAMIVINTQDGFDSARILVPHIREFLAEKLGKSFYFGIPNRDFLICWSKDAEKNFQQTLRNQIALDFKERPYPLSKYTFEFCEDGQIKQIENQGFAEDFGLNLSNN